ncbi:histidine kinase [Nocardia yamanashiensis]|uniref:sensor histidine kinase n=1 Tax=Nocardia yamanashiensis TaxID=209247 RepID=UPI001E4E2B7B|nr:histidine kinase [Nocardia yamanashiensis]UGT44312.1 histidine kinase [Nocardia yamanashiensis]
MGRQPGWILVAVMLLGQLVARTGALISEASPFTSIGTIVLMAIIALQAVISLGRWRPTALLGLQAILVFAPYLWLGAAWGPVAGLLGAAIALTLRPRLAWPLFAAVVVGESVLNRVLDGWFGAVSALVVDLNVGLTFYAAVYLVRQLDRTARERRKLAAVAVATEQLRTAARLHDTLGAELGAIIRQLRQAPGRVELTRIAESSRNALTTVRSVADAQRAAVPATGDAPPPTSEVRFAWWFLLFLLINCSLMPLINIAQLGVSRREFVLIIVLMIISGALQLHHGAPRTTPAQPHAWPWTLSLHGVVVGSALVLPAWPAATAAPFLLMFGAMVVRIRAIWTWALVLVCSLAAAWTFHWDGIHFGWRIYWSVTSVIVVAYVYVLCRIPEVDRELQRTRAQALRMAVVAERLRVARDVHDLLGQTLSALTLNAELAARRPSAESADELRQLADLAGRALEEVRSITRGPAELSLTAEIAGARSVLEATGAEVSIDVAPDAPESRVLAIVLREAVTNIVRHSEADLASIRVTADENAMRMQITNNRAASVPLERQGTGLTNMTVRLTESGGNLATERDSDRFTLTATLPR